MNTAELTFEQGVMAGAGGVAAILILIFILRPWRRAMFSGAYLPLGYIIGMRLRGTPPCLLVDAYIELIKRGNQISMDVVECLYLQHKLKIRTSHDLAKICLAVSEKTHAEDGQQPSEP